MADETTIHSMEVTIEPQGWRPTFTPKCSDPTADCHYVCAEDCETWGPIVRNEAGAVIGHETDEPHVTHRMEHVEECTLVDWLENSDELPDDMVGEPISLTVPAKFEFQGDYVTWEATR